MKHFVLPVLLASLMGSLVPYLACDCFDAPLAVGLLSFDIVVMLLLVQLKRSLVSQIVLAAFPIGILFVGQSSYFVALILFYEVLIWLSYGFSEKNNLKFVLLIFFSIFVFVSNWSLFFESAFSMSLGELWGVAKFFWWGVALFVLVPVVQFLVLFVITRRVLFVSDYALNVRMFAIVLVAAFAVHYAVASVVTWQPVLDFPVYSFFKQQLQPGRETRNTILREDVKRAYSIVSDDELKLDSLRPTVMILAESWGIRKDFRLNDAEFELFKDNKIRLKGLWKRTASFTQSAEFEDFGIKSKASEKTLMKNFQDKGFDTWYVHGFEGAFYGRQSSYDTLGFDHVMFKEQFARDSLSLCPFGNKGFEGVCDSSIVSYIDRLLKDSIPRFIYWTTLDSHPPYVTQKVPDDPMCTDLTEVQCVHEVRIRNSLKHISILANKHPEYQFIIRGDHRPAGVGTPSSFITEFYYGWVPVIVLN